MLFVPYVPAPPRPSPTAQELGRRLRETIQGFLQEHPDTSGLEIRQALQLAVRDLRGKSVPAAAAVGAGLVLFALLALALLGGMLPGTPRVWILATAAGLAVVAAALAIALRSR